MKILNKLINLLETEKKVKKYELENDDIHYAFFFILLVISLVGIIYNAIGLTDKGQSISFVFGLVNVMGIIIYSILTGDELGYSFKYLFKTIKNFIIKGTFKSSQKINEEYEYTIKRIKHKELSEIMLYLVDNEDLHPHYSYIKEELKKELKRRVIAEKNRVKELREIKQDLSEITEEGQKEYEEMIILKEKEVNIQSLWGLYE